jgi:hypothetical protein
MSNRPKLLLPATLALLGIALLSGCVLIPTFGVTMKGRNVGKEVGDKGSDKPVRVGRATEADGRRLLGDPPYSSDDGRVFAYTWMVRNGVIVFPLCFSADSLRGHRTLVLRFDEAGVLELFKVHNSDEQFWWPAPAAPVLPPEVLPPGGAHPAAHPAGARRLTGEGNVMGERPRIEYRTPPTVPRGPDPESTWKRFLIGLGLGTAVSAMLWIGGPAASRFVPASVVFGLASIVVPGTKLVIGLSMLSQPPWKSFGNGLLASMAVGFLILCGVCWRGLAAQ